jgi:hypothetical protein
VQLRFKTGERVSNTLQQQDSAGTFIAVRHRAAGSSSVYFGPFATMDDLRDWANEHRMSVGVIVLVDPSSDPDGWWDN